VLTGISAGSICWHVGGTTDSFGPQLRAVTDGLGFVPYANGVHYDSEDQRRPLLHRLVGGGMLPAAYATDDGAGVLYRGTQLVAAVAEKAMHQHISLRRSTARPQRRGLIPGGSRTSRLRVAPTPQNVLVPTRSVGETAPASVCPIAWS
jgi:peptidase E